MLQLACNVWIVVHKLEGMSAKCYARSRLQLIEIRTRFRLLSSRHQLHLVFES